MTSDHKIKLLTTDMGLLPNIHLKCWAFPIAGDGVREVHLSVYYICQSFHLPIRLIVRI